MARRNLNGSLATNTPDTPWPEPMHRFPELPESVQKAMAELVNTIASHTGSGESSRSIAYDEDELVERLGAFAGGFAKECVVELNRRENKSRNLSVQQIAIVHDLLEKNFWAICNWFCKAGSASAMPRSGSGCPTMMKRATCLGIPYELACYVDEKLCDLSELANLFEELKDEFDNDEPLLELFVHGRTE